MVRCQVSFAAWETNAPESRDLTPQTNAGRVPLSTHRGRAIVYSRSRGRHTVKYIGKQIPKLAQCGNCATLRVRRRTVTLVNPKCQSHK